MRFSSGMITLSVTRSKPTKTPRFASCCAISALGSSRQHTWPIARCFGFAPAASSTSSCFSAASIGTGGSTTRTPVYALCVKIGRPLFTCAFPTALLADFAERAEALLARVAHQLVGDLIGALRRDVGRVVALHVEAAARDDVHTRFVRDASERGEVAIHVGMPAVDNAADAVLAGGSRLLDHQIHVVGKAGGHGTARL